jgi:RimJ/RimL family protein N-acetyltransferase
MSEIKTVRLLLKPANFEDLTALNEIHEQVREYFSFDPSHIAVTPERCLTEGDLPPDGTKENYEIYTINENGKVIGYFDFYKGFPQKGIVYISLMFISKDKRKYGYGKEIVNAVCEYFEDIGLNEVRLTVSLKNWLGLIFWHKCGFDKITLVAGDDNFSINGYACLELKKSLTVLT